MTAGAVQVPQIFPLKKPVPGQSKSYIDSATKIIIESATENVNIYFSLNGEKPEPFNLHSPNAKMTYKYKSPFRLPLSGKVTIKAIAVSHDGKRESHIVTKKFDVEKISEDEMHDDEDGLEFVNDISHDVVAQREVKQFSPSMVSSREAWAEIRRIKEAGVNNRRPLSSHGNWSNQNSARGIPDQSMNGRKYLPNQESQILRLQRETDITKCPTCLAPRPADLSVRFCYECGGDLPVVTINKAVSAKKSQMGTCPMCHMNIPLNVPNCIMCEASLVPVQNHFTQCEKRVCDACGTANPADFVVCMTCENVLTNSSVQILAGKTSLGFKSSPEGKMVACCKCGRVNTGDARYCDWCGVKSSTPGQTVVCCKCRSYNDGLAKFCVSCGTPISAPPRPDRLGSGVTIGFTNGEGRSGSKFTIRGGASNCVATQTVGLYYPSEKEMSKHDRDGNDRAIERELKERKPLLTAISPGRGYWRKQVDHVCAHLKAEAHNDPEFRALISEPRMGKILSTGVHEDEDELSITLKFAIRDAHDGYNSLPKQQPNGYVDGRRSAMSRLSSRSSVVSGSTTARSRTSRRRKKTVSKSRDKGETLKKAEKQLLRSVGENGDGNPGDIQHLVEENEANVDCVDKDGWTAFHLCALNRHVDAIGALAELKADINKQDPKGNSALHLAVRHGHAGLDTIDALLKVGIKTSLKNGKGESAYDLAVKGGFDSIGNLLASNLGQLALDKLIKPKGSVSIDSL